MNKVLILTSRQSRVTSLDFKAATIDINNGANLYMYVRGVARSVPQLRGALRRLSAPCFGFMAE